jgi:hypothetical protein
MAGDINNDDILTALNQMVKALNDISLKSSGGSGGSTGCGCPGGTDPPTGPGSEGGEPPDGWDGTGLEGSEYNTRKCKAANLTHEWVKEVVTRFTTGDVEGIAPGLGGTWALLIGFLTSLLAGLYFVWAVAIIGWLSAMATVIINNTIGFGDLLTILGDNDEDLVCALYTATSSGEARANYIDVAETGGANAAQILFLQAVLSLDDILNTLFFDPTDDDRNSELSALIGGYAGGVDCSLCTICPVTYDALSDWGSWTTDTLLINGGFASGGPGSGLLNFNVGLSATSGVARGELRFIVPLSEVMSAGWVPSTDAQIQVAVGDTSPGAVGYGICITYASDPIQDVDLGALASGGGFETFSINPNSDDTITAIRIRVGNTRTSGSGAANNTGTIIGVTFCNH